MNDAPTRSPGGDPYGTTRYVAHCLGDGRQTCPDASRPARTPRGVATWMRTHRGRTGHARFTLATFATVDLTCGDASGPAATDAAGLADGSDADDPAAPSDLSPADRVGEPGGDEGAPADPAASDVAAPGPARLADEPDTSDPATPSDLSTADLTPADLAAARLTVTSAVTSTGLSAGPGAGSTVRPHVDPDGRARARVAGGAFRAASAVPALRLLAVVVLARVDRVWSRAFDRALERLNREPTRP
ncbi:hypothetical protein [Streptomyces sp. NPDC057702]|uniref:hypothetical protein n=1 Tax=unclassified Streptomyces TaxID=2593676 RepID=UPI0036A0570C